MSNGKKAGTGGGGSSRSCLMYGCLTLVVLFIAVAVGTFFIVRYAANEVGAVAERYTDTAPLPLERVDMPTEEYSALESRLREFQVGLKEGSRIEPLVLTGRELNALIERHPGLEPFRDLLRIEVEGDLLKGQVSLPLDELAKFWLFRFLGWSSRVQGRYLNGMAVLQVNLVDGKLDVRATAIEVKGEPLPEQWTSQLRLHNLAQDLEKNEDLSRTLGQLKSIEVADGEVTIKAAGSE